MLNYSFLLALSLSMSVGWFLLWDLVLYSLFCSPLGKILPSLSWRMISLRDKSSSMYGRHLKSFALNWNEITCLYFSFVGWLCWRILCSLHEWSSRSNLDWCLSCWCLSGPWTYSELWSLTSGHRWCILQRTEPWIWLIQRKAVVKADWWYSSH